MSACGLGIQVAQKLVHPQAQVRNHMWRHTPGNRFGQIGNPKPAKGEERGEGGGREAQDRQASRDGKLVEPEETD